ncbi:hypothetical protein ABVK25_010027 [Lepraria finkii]|uniref:Uncharacterized protein n=1 Tax=Lepraria finkii TaxID=1340010 RepID=A0ABR4AY17_9LECA
MKLVCRFRTYCDENLPRDILHTRWLPLLDALFLNLHGGDRQAVNDLNKDQKVEGILEKLVPPLPSSDPLDIQELHELLQEEDVSQSAVGLNEASCSAFKRIPFSDWARKARDPHELVELVDDFLDWHGSLQDIVESRLRDNPDEMEKYVQMETLLPEYSPARWAVSQGLQYHRCNTDTPQPCDQFNLNELEAFFTRQHRNHIAAVRQLAVLELRFQRMFLNEEEVDWSQRFWTNVDFFEQITTTPATEIADFLTKLDLKKLRSVPPQEFIDGKGHRLQHVHRRCNRLCEAIQESIIFAEQLSPPVARLAEVGFISVSLRTSHK